DVRDDDRPEPGVEQRLSRASAVRDEEVRDADARVREHAAAFEADAGRSERLAQVGERAGAVVEPHLDVLPAAHAAGRGGHAATTVGRTTTSATSDRPT